MNRLLSYAAYAVLAVALALAWSALAQDADADVDAEVDGQPAASERDDERRAEAHGLDGWFSFRQANRGQRPYLRHCAECHGDGLRGDPPLIGESFITSFHTVGELYDYTRRTMPQDAPGSLSDEMYADITAYVLDRNRFPGGESDLVPGDREAMDDMPLDAEHAKVTFAEDAPEQDRIASERGSEAYAQHCARCHGASLQGNTAPPLGGAVFLERWQGHPVDWFYFQASASMPPHDVRVLSDTEYVDIVVYLLTEAGVLEGYERFQPHDEAFRSLVIVPRQFGEELDETQDQVQRLREALHDPHGEGVDPGVDPIPSLEWPDDPGAAPIGPRGRVDAATAVSEVGTPDDGDVADEDEDEGGGDADDDGDDDDARLWTPAAALGA